MNIVKIFWFARRKIKLSLKYYFFRFTGGSYFKTIGKNTQFFGRVRFGTIENNISLGENCWIGHDVFFSATRGATIQIGDNCSANTGCHIVATNSIIIKNGTRIGEYCSIRDQNHAFDDLSTPIYKQGFFGSPITIGENCWIGRGVMITPGVTLGNGCVIGANSVVTKSFEADSVIAGVPAKFIRKRGQSKI
jgi:acetyltransferase-like isoleucine patch superfamily enzyme